MESQGFGFCGVSYYVVFAHLDTAGKKDLSQHNCSLYFIYCFGIWISNV